MARKRVKAQSWSTGEKGRNTVRAFEREPGSKTFYIEWYVKDRHGDRQTIRERVKSRRFEDAKKRAVEKAGELGTGLDTGIPACLEDVLNDYIEALAASWSDSHEKRQRRFREFWIEALGANLRLAQLNPAMVESVVSKAGEREAWSGRTRESYLKFIRAAARWAFRKANLVARDVLNGTDYPRYESRSEAYSTEELNAISGVADQVDPRFQGVWEIIACTGRRVNAVRTLRVENLEYEEDEELWVEFPAETDKARRRGRVLLAQQAREAVEVLLEMGEVKESGWLFPRGRLDYADDHDGPIGESSLLRMLQKAEKLAGVEHVHGRAFHGSKRRVITELMADLGGDADAVGRVTGNITPSLIEQVYRQTDDQLLRFAAEAMTERRNHKEG
jgi:integrase